MTNSKISTPEIYHGYEIAQVYRDKIHKTFSGLIVPEHTQYSHHYRCNLFPDAPLYDSVTTKTGILGEEHIKNWAIRTSLSYVKNNHNGNPVDDFLLDEAENAPTKIFKRAGVVGTEVHQAVEDYLIEWIRNNERPSYEIKTLLSQTTDNEVLSGVVAAQSFLNDHWIIPISPELLVASQKLQVAGTMDFLAFVGTETKPATKSGPREYYAAKLTDSDERQFFVECVNTGHQIRFELTIIDWKTSSSIEKPAYLLQVAAYRECLKELIGINVNKAIIVQLSKSNGQYKKAHIGRNQLNKAVKRYIDLSRVYDWLKSDMSKVNVDVKAVNELKI